MFHWLDAGQVLIMDEGGISSYDGIIGWGMIQLCLTIERSIEIHQPEQ